MKRRPLLLAAALLLGGCAAAPLRPPAARDQVRDFAFEARFALRATAPDGSAQSAGGRLSWTHRDGGERILLANPLGVGIAEIDATPGRARLRTADGKEYEADDPDLLVEQVTGQPLPVARLPAWLLGRSAGTAARDAAGRPLHLADAGWLIDYAYDDDRGDALPTRITLRRGDEIELRLRIEEWRTPP